MTLAKRKLPLMLALGGLGAAGGVGVAFLTRWLGSS